MPFLFMRSPWRHYDSFGLSMVVYNGLGIIIKEWQPGLVILIYVFYRVNRSRILINIYSIKNFIENLIIVEPDFILKRTGSPAVTEKMIIFKLDF